MPHPIPPVNYFSSEDAPLLSDYPRQHSSLDVHYDSHATDFDVAVFPETPLLPDVTDTHDDNFSDFVSSPTSEFPPTQYHKGHGDASTVAELSDTTTLEYIQHVAIIIIVQLFIPIPFMIPMGINFAKRALRVLLLGSAAGFVGHSLFNIALALPTARLLDMTFLPIFRQHLPSAFTFLPAFLGQMKIAILGGVVVGAIMAHVLNIFILGHTICRLARGLDADPTAMRRAMDSSKSFQLGKRFVLDTLTAIFMVPAGVAAQGWCMFLIFMYNKIVHLLSHKFFLIIGGKSIGLWYWYG